MTRLLIAAFLLSLFSINASSQTCMDGQCPTGIEVTPLNSQEFLFTLQNSCPDAQVSWFWNQNTPQTVMAQSITHSFAESGTYTVVAAVRDLDCPGGVAYLTSIVKVIFVFCMK